MYKVVLSSCSSQEISKCSFSMSNGSISLCSNNGGGSENEGENGRESTKPSFEGLIDGQ